MVTNPTITDAAVEAAWPEFRSHMEPERWQLADPPRIDRLRKIIAAALPHMQQAGGVGECVWTKTKPTRAGVYGVRGFNFGESAADQFEAIVAVRRYEDELVCNLHESTSEDDFDNWMLVSDCSDKFEWCEFVPATPAQPEAGVPEGYVLVPVEPTEAMIEACCAAFPQGPRGAYAAMLAAAGRGG